MSSRHYQVYFDTSGSASNSEILTTAALVADVPSWQRADREWLSVLRRYSVRRFHMREMVHWRGSFSQWIDPFTGRRDEATRQSFFEELVGVIERNVDALIVNSVLKSAFDAVNDEYELAEFFNGSAFCALQVKSLEAAREYLVRHTPRRPRVRFALIFEKGDAEQHQFRRFASDYYRLNLDFKPKLDAASGEEVTPFSMADLIAWEMRREYVDWLPRRRPPTSGERSPRARLIRKLLRERPHWLDEKYFRNLVLKANITKRTTLSDRSVALPPGQPSIASHLSAS